MKKITILIVMAVLCINFSTKSQQTYDPHEEQKATVHQYYLGTKLPDSFWRQQHSFLTKGKIEKQSLLEHRTKLIVIDFWATWCTICRRKLPILDSLQKVYPKELAVVPVVSNISHDKIGNIEKVMDGKFKPSIPYALSTIVNDDFLTALFPYRTLSHVAWIQDEMIIALTESDFLNAQSIEKLILEARARKLAEATKGKAGNGQ